MVEWFLHRWLDTLTAWHAHKITTIREFVDLLKPVVKLLKHYYNYP